ncbi:HpcH/HpaI aldolase family protein [Microbacterium rhizosphaerae]|uniref:Aldolase/citrate lyase family protein n=1 Tax=Microbacterium rhizosphaerae TaxID=1678237 RepID=A0ABZ0SMP6_9MICO|nr:aldolase/citrate lyase family protein [Microbacterium rhizosphaerae]WPR89464.1 aldolase/citrate lyase family protein [Microbacterium rhizosphaerae]
MSASLRARARSGDRLLGVLLRMPAEELVEMAAVAGYDFILMDCEHGPADVVALRQHMALAEAHGVPVLVRVGEGDDAAILRVLDQGAQGVVVPHLDSDEDARRAVAAAHYPPVGHRGFATYSRAGRFGTRDAAEHRDWFLQNTLVIGMIESPLGVSAASAIIATPALDGIMVGPSDLAASSGPDDPPPAVATGQVHVELARAGSLRMDIVGSPEAAARAFADGAGIVVYNLAHVLMAHLRSALDARS